MDRHIAAFAATRMRSLPDQTLNMLADVNDLPNYRLGILYVLAEAHRSADTQQRYPHVSKWMGKLLEPVVEQFHNRAYKVQLHEEIERASSKGDLMQLQFLVDNMDARAQDIRGYEKARAEHANLVQGITWLEGGGLTAPSRVMEKGQQAATVISAMISGVLIIALTVIYVV
jgi:hypothetical protein